MSDTVIRVENLSKKYVLSHQKEGGSYKALRDVIADGAKSLTQRFSFKSPHTRSADAHGGSPHPTPNREEFWALKDVSFDIKQGDRVGIIGRNGAGKSTLLKILSRIVEPTSGSIRIKGRVASLLEVGTGFHPELTGRENIFLNGAILGMGKAEIQRKFDEIVAFAEVEKFLDTPVKRYSSGMYVRLAFAVAAHLEPEILIVDEVLAVGDAAFQKKCLGKMEEVGKEGRTVLFVSHNVATVKQLCTRGILLDKGSVHTQGEIHDTLDKYEKVIFTRSDSSCIPGLIYEQKDPQTHTNFYIRKIEILDKENQKKYELSTWDYVKFRIHYVARKNIKMGSGVFSVMTVENVQILLCSTMPDRTVQMEIFEGESYFDCCFESWPLAAGEYLIQAGLAIPKTEWLCQIKESVPLLVKEKDVFESGMPPIRSRYLLATPYEIYPNANN